MAWVWLVLMPPVVPDTATVCVCAAPLDPVLTLPMAKAGVAEPILTPPRTSLTVCVWLALAVPDADELSEKLCV
jgi:hypothetical protein